VFLLTFPIALGATKAGSWPIVVGMACTRFWWTVKYVVYRSTGKRSLYESEHDFLLLRIIGPVVDLQVCGLACIKKFHKEFSGP
jgi:hypothetical protein